MTRMEFNCLWNALEGILEELRKPTVDLSCLRKLSAFQLLLEEQQDLLEEMEPMEVASRSSDERSLGPLGLRMG